MAPDGNYKIKKSRSLITEYAFPLCHCKITAFFCDKQFFVIGFSTAQDELYELGLMLRQGSVWKHFGWKISWDGEK